MQHDGEISGVTIKCPLEQVEVTFVVQDDRVIQVPQGETPAGWSTSGFESNLEMAMFTVLNAMLNLIVAGYQFSRTEALALANLLVNLRITQIVNGVRAVHALLLHSAIAFTPIGTVSTVSLT